MKRLRYRPSGHILEIPEGKTVAKCTGEYGYIDGYVTRGEDDRTYAIFCDVKTLKITEIPINELYLMNVQGDYSKEEG